MRRAKVLLESSLLLGRADDLMILVVKIPSFQLFATICGRSKENDNAHVTDDQANEPRSIEQQRAKLRRALERGEVGYVHFDLSPTVKAPAIYKQRIYAAGSACLPQIRNPLIDRSKLFNWRTQRYYDTSLRACDFS